MRKSFIGFAVLLSFVFGVLTPIGNALNLFSGGGDFISEVEAKKKKKKKKKKSKKKKSKNTSNINNSNTSNTSNSSIISNINNDTNNTDRNDSQQSNYNCISDKYNCSNFNSCSQAKEVYNYCLNSVGYDVHKLDADNDGIPCESICK